MNAAGSATMVDRAAGKMQETGVGLLWGTANLFSHPRYAAGAATNPDPELFARAAAQVCAVLEATHQLQGQNYVLWGGREGYETLLNTDLGREHDQMARFLHMVVEHKHRIGFDGTILLEPKPFEPTKHQYDHDTATVFAFLQRYDLVDEIKVNVEVNHGALAGYDFHHELAYAVNAGILGSVDANAGDDRLGWDVDRFPVSVEQMTLGVYEVLRGGGLGSGGFNFDAKLRRMSIERDDLFHAHIGGMDTVARALLAAVSLLESDELESFRRERYAAWDGELGQQILDGKIDLPSLRERALDLPDPTAVSGRQEMLENLVARHIERTHWIVADRPGALVAGVDSSTQSTKVEVRSVDTGEVIAVGRSSHPATTPPVSEQDPESWWRALVDVFAQIPADTRHAVSALSVAGHSTGWCSSTRTAVVSPAQLWNDTRSDRRRPRSSTGRVGAAGLGRSARSPVPRSR